MYKYFRNVGGRTWWINFQFIKSTSMLRSTVKGQSHNIGVKTGVITPVGPSETTHSYFEPADGVEKLDLKRLAASVTKII